MTGPGDTDAREKAAQAFGRLYDIVARLRGPGGCPWDREQSPDTLRGNIVEEAYELVEAIDEKEPFHIKEEAGDLYLLSTMIAYMHEESGDFSVSDSLDDICEKLIRRHPHVFADAKADSPEAVLRQWNSIKEKVEGRAPRDSVLDGVSRALPPLERAFKLQKKAAKVGFDWPRAEDVWAKVEEELDEARAAWLAAGGDAAAADHGGRRELELELGDLFFSMVNLSRFLGIDPALALGAANEKFSRRFRHVETRMKAEGRGLGAENALAMNTFWDEAKSEEARSYSRRHHE